MKAKFTIAIILLCISVSGCFNRNETVSQFSTINALMAGCYQGQFKCSDLNRIGNFGIGTFDNLDGEMILLDSTIYQVKSDGTVARVSKNLLTPFAFVTKFNSDKQITLKGNYNFLELQQQIDSRLQTRNIFYAIRIDASFENVRTRSVPAQQKPYPKLTEVVKEQPIFQTTDTMGTLVGFKCPDYIYPINVPGYHMHFVSDTRDFGGHLLECRVHDPVINIDYIRQIELILPPGGDFDDINLEITDRNSLDKAEK